MNSKASDGFILNNNHRQFERNTGCFYRDVVENFFPWRRHLYFTPLRSVALDVTVVGPDLWLLLSVHHDKLRTAL